MPSVRQSFVAIILFISVINVCCQEMDILHMSCLSFDKCGLVYYMAAAAKTTGFPVTATMAPKYSLCIDIITCNRSCHHN